MSIRNIRKSARGFTLVELMIVVAIVGVLAALAIYGVRRYVLNAKTAEARNSIGQMGKDAATAYSRDGMAAGILAIGASTDVSNRLCGSAAQVPSTADNIAGKKYQSKPSEWATGDQYTGWTCLRFSMQDPQFYMYNYTLSGSSFAATAQGDLDGNKTLSTFTLEGKLQAENNVVVVTLSPNIKEDKPDE